MGSQFESCERDDLLVCLSCGHAGHIGSSYLSCCPERKPVNALEKIESLTAEVGRRDELLSQLYQIVGSMASDIGVFEYRNVQELLTEISSPTGERFLPWPSFEREARFKTSASCLECGATNIAVEVTAADRQRELVDGAYRCTTCGEEIHGMSDHTVLGCPVMDELKVVDELKDPADKGQTDE